jgi:hypothetical protein
MATFLKFTRNTFIALTMIFTFIAWPLAILTFFIFCIAQGCYANTAEGKASAAKREADAVEAKAKQLANAEATKAQQEVEAKRVALAVADATRAEADAAKNLEENYEKFSKNPTDTKALNIVLIALEGLDRKKLQPLIVRMILPLLEMRPLDPRVRTLMLSCAQTAAIKSSPIDSSSQLISKLFYDMSLSILQRHPDQQTLKSYALEVGRWSCSIARFDGKVTLYDEQSILNDILVRSR